MAAVPAVAGSGGLAPLGSGDDPSIVLEGYLQVRANDGVPGLRRWLKRYFVLRRGPRREHCVLQRFHSPAEAEDPKATPRAYPIKGIARTERDLPPRFSIVLKSRRADSDKGEQLKLAAETETERESWIRAIAWAMRTLPPSDDEAEGPAASPGSPVRLAFGVATPEALAGADAAAADAVAGGGIAGFGSGPATFKGRKMRGGAAGSRGGSVRLERGSAGRKGSDESGSGEEEGSTARSATAGLAALSLSRASGASAAAGGAASKRGASAASADSDADSDPGAAAPGRKTAGGSGTARTGSSAGGVSARSEEAARSGETAPAPSGGARGAAAARKAAAASRAAGGGAAKAKKGSGSSASSPAASDAEDGAKRAAGKHRSKPAAAAGESTGSSDS